MIHQSGITKSSPHFPHLPRRIPVVRLILLALLHAAPADAESTLDEALDTPGIAWTPAMAPGGSLLPAGTSDTTARGGAMVAIARDATLSTTIQGPCVLKIRCRSNRPFLVSNGVHLNSPLRVLHPLTDGWQEWAWEMPAGEAAITFSGSGTGTQIDFVEITPPPPSIALPLGLEEGAFSTGGSTAWTVAPYLELGGYGARIATLRDGGESWLELPVSGPAELRFRWKSDGYNTGFEVRVDGRQFHAMEGTTTSRSVRLEIPAGPHTVRWLARPPEDRPTFAALIANIEVRPLPAGGETMAVLGISQPLAISGDWTPGAAISRDGGMALQAPAAGSTEFDWYRDHRINTRFQGPGQLDFWWFAGPDPVTGRRADWRFETPANNRLLAGRSSSSPAGWKHESIWLPPGDFRYQWSFTGAAEGAAFGALDEVIFTPSKIVPPGEAVGATELVWTTDAGQPWLGVVLPEEEGSAALAPPLAHGERATLATTVHGPGTLRYRWKNAKRWPLLGEFRIDGVIRDRAESYHQNDVLEFVLPVAGPVTLEWIAAAPEGLECPDGLLGVTDVVWEPFPDRPLDVALDAGKKVRWSSSPTRPFTGTDDPGAAGGTSAFVDLLPGEESWLEATVTGPGVFDFWLRDAAGSDLSSDLWDYWSLEIDGREVSIGGTSWPAQWITGPGTHRIRLVFRHPEGTGLDWIAGAVDQVSWQPLKKLKDSRAAGLASLKWRTSRDGVVAGFKSAGRNGAPALVFDTYTDGPEWMETTVKGPCELSWDSSLTENEGTNRYLRNSLLIDGATVIPAGAHEWQRMRLSVPAGNHVVRWVADPWIEPDSEPGPAAFDSVWRISRMSIRRGISPLLKTLGAPELFALEIGDSGGSPVATPGGKSWQAGVQTSLYFFHPDRAGTLSARWGRPDSIPGGWDYEDEEGYGDDLWADGPGWQSHVSVLRPGGFSRWSYRPPSWWDPELEPPLLETMVFEGSEIRSLGDAADMSGPWVSDSWAGRTEPQASGEDAAWSFVNRPQQNNIAGITLTGPARVSFRWRSTGSGILQVNLDGGMIPVPEATGDWREVTFDINSGEHLVEWIHRGTSSASGEAWLDGVNLLPSLSRDLTGSATSDPAIVLETTDESPLSWHPVAHAESDGTWTEAVRATSGSRVLRTTVEGPAVLTFRGRCLADAPPSSGESIHERSVVMDTGGNGIEIIGHELMAEVDGLPMERISEDPSRAWQEVSLNIPAGSHEATFRLMTHQRSWFGESRVDATRTDVQGWVQDFRLLSTREHFAEWSSAHGLPAAIPADDDDGDGSSNELEYRLRSHPADPGSRPAALGMMETNPSRSEPRRWLMVPYAPANSGGTLETSSDLVVWQASEATLLHEPPLSSWIVGPESTPFTTTHHGVALDESESHSYFRLRFPPVE